MDRQKRVLAIHDISCFGRCSLTVALPIISAAGLECTVIPTAVLSTHTGGFTGYTYRDLTEDIVPIVDHWKSLGLRFDSIYTGFLGSFEQIDIVKGTVDRVGDGALVVVDPVMADNGKLYPIFPEEFPAGMRSLCQKADVILPNMTEAALMLGEAYVEPPYTREYVEGLLRRLSGICKGKVILTGVSFEEGRLGAAAYDSAAGKADYAFRDAIPGYYHGTGDVFGSAAVAALVSGRTLAEACRIAVDYTVGSIARTREAGTDIRFGVDFEEGLPDLARAVRGRDVHPDDARGGPRPRMGRPRRGHRLRGHVHRLLVQRRRNHRALAHIQRLPRRHRRAAGHVLGRRRQAGRAGAVLERHCGLRRLHGGELHPGEEVPQGGRLHPRRRQRPPAGPGVHRVHQPDKAPPQGETGGARRHRGQPAPGGPLRLLVGLAEEVGPLRRQGRRDHLRDGRAQQPGAGAAHEGRRGLA